MVKSIKTIYLKFRNWFPIFKLAHKQYCEKLRKEYQGGEENITLLASNCIGGEIYYDLGLKFNSPTINLWMVQPDFLKLAKNLQYYIDLDLVFNDKLENKYNCPVGLLGKNEKETIMLVFLHYKTREEAYSKWNERKKRINYDRIALLMSDRDGITYEDLIEFGKIPCWRKVVFTYKDYPELVYTFRLEQEKGKEYVRNYQIKKWNTFWRWESQFNCAKWLIEEK